MGRLAQTLGLAGNNFDLLAEIAIQPKNNLEYMSMVTAAALPPIHPADLSSVKIAEALENIQTKFTKLQRETLSALYFAPNQEMLVDEKGQYSNIINALGKIGGMLSRELGFKPDGGYHLLWIANQNTNPENGKRYWRMKANFSAALAIVSWA